MGVFCSIVWCMNTPLSILKKNGLKSTAGRIQILETLIESPHPLSVESLFVKIKKIIDVSTIYRTLNEFSEKGIVDTIHLEKNKLLFEIRDGRHHHHIRCTKCDTIEDVELCEIDTVSKKILSHSRSFQTIIRHSLEFFGLCNKCSKKSLS